jgi:DNA-binding MarR family transcriptional regulator
LSDHAGSLQYDLAMALRHQSGARSELDPVLEFLRLLWSIEHGLQRMSHRMRSDLGVTGPQRLLLRVVERFPGISAGELAALLRLHPSTLTEVLQRLVTRGFLERTRDPDDSRRARFRLKRPAKTVMHIASGTVEQAVARALESSGAVASRGARKVLTALVAQLDESEATAAATRRVRR